MNKTIHNCPNSNSKPDANPNFKGGRQLSGHQFTVTFNDSNLFPTVDIFIFKDSHLYSTVDIFVQQILLYGT